MPDDWIVYLRTYTAHAQTGYMHSETNDLISNLKKGVDRKGKDEYWYKEQAIRRCIKDLNMVFRTSKASRASTVVPIPSSKSKDDPLYDDRLLQIATGATCFDCVKELLIQPKSRKSERGGSRLHPDQLVKLWEIDESQAEPEPDKIIIFDDVIIHGSQFRAADTMLRKRFPNAQIRGLMIARGEWEEND